MSVIDPVREAEIAMAKSIASARWQTSGPHVDQHVGDIAWGPADRSHPMRIVLLDDRACAWSHRDPFRICAKPGHEDLYEELIDLVGHDEKFWVLDSESDKIDALSSRGFAATDDGHTFHLFRELDDLPEVTLPEGFAIRDATDPAEWARRVAVHRAAWEPSRFTEQIYDVVRASPPYRPELDVGIVSPNGDWASYCIAWIDSDARAGELEPVGTAPGYRRRGFGAAACLAALTRLREAGATRCVVGAVTDPDNQGPRHLYESIGFHVIGRLQSFGRR